MSKYLIMLLSKTEQGEKLKEVRKKLGLAQWQIAEKIGISQPGWAQAEKGKNALKTSNLLKIEELGINTRYITHGDKSMTHEARNNFIKMISGAALAGLSHQPQQKHEIIGEVLIPNIDGKELFAITVSGTSMEPEIKEGSIVILKKMGDKAEFINNKPYLIIFEGIPFLKRIEMIMGGDNSGKFKIKSDNEVKEQVLSGEEIESWYKVTHVINEV